MMEEEEIEDEEILFFSLQRNKDKSVTAEANIILYLKDGSYHATRKIRLKRKKQ